VGMHIAAVIKHKFIDRDQILERMLPKGWSK
jgi:cytochrome b561